MIDFFIHAGLLVFVLFIMLSAIFFIYRFWKGIIIVAINAYQNKVSFLQNLKIAYELMFKTTYVTKKNFHTIFIVSVMGSILLVIVILIIEWLKFKGLLN